MVMILRKSRDTQGAHSAASRPFDSELVGVKRRRPEDGPEQRPSLDLAKMAQNCQTFSSLSCLSSGTEDRGPRSPFALHVGSTSADHSRSVARGPPKQVANLSASRTPGVRGPPIGKRCSKGPWELPSFGLHR
ncbi:Protein FAM53B [Myotis davidii]|uniref:Protein FAM53B n=1 Tax=Myotis davidii TaxID=225400 RepID=L5MGG6_MYODS|nr:Protein FAM53B [Myotis davidii]